MSSNLLALVMDVVVLGFLVATIFYVLRLSKGLNEFKSHRKEFDSIITSLLSSIDKAERSIHNLKKVSVQEAAELESLIKQSRAMCEELEIINEAGENMAKRLEKIAEKNRVIAQQYHPIIEDNQGVNIQTNPKEYSNKKYTNKVRSSKNDYRATLKKVSGSLDKNIIKSDNAPLPSFMIQDRDFEKDNTFSGDINTDHINDDLQSKAEKELFAALHRGKHSNTNMGDI